MKQANIHKKLAPCLALAILMASSTASHAQPSLLGASFEPRQDSQHEADGTLETRNIEDAEKLRLSVLERKKAVFESMTKNVVEVQTTFEDIKHNLAAAVKEYEQNPSARTKAQLERSLVDSAKRGATAMKELAKLGNNVADILGSLRKEADIKIEESRALETESWMRVETFEHTLDVLEAEKDDLKKIIERLPEEEGLPKDLAKSIELLQIRQQEAEILMQLEEHTAKKLGEFRMGIADAVEEYDDVTTKAELISAKASSTGTIFQAIGRSQGLVIAKEIDRDAFGLGKEFQDLLTKGSESIDGLRKGVIEESARRQSRGRSLARRVTRTRPKSRSEALEQLNGSTSRSSSLSAWSRLQKKHDLNGDKAITELEWARSKELFDEYDKDKSGRITERDFTNLASLISND